VEEYETYFRIIPSSIGRQKHIQNVGAYGRPYLVKQPNKNIFSSYYMRASTYVHTWSLQSVLAVTRVRIPSIHPSIHPSVHPSIRGLLLLVYLGLPRHILYFRVLYVAKCVGEKCNERRNVYL